MKSNIQKESTACPVCGEQRAALLYHGNEHEYDNTTDDSFACHECATCGCWYLNPRPAASELPTIYPLNYYAYSATRQAIQYHETPKTTYGKIGKYKLRRRYDPILATVPVTPETRWLEIGCACGANLDFVRHLFRCRTFGVELSEESAQIARSKGHSVIEGNFEELEFGGERFDVISSSHVIEHLSSPYRFLTKTRSLLSDNGYCIYDTPNTDTWEARLFGPQWGGWHFPRHWALLNRRCAEFLAEASGFNLVRIVCSTNGAFWGWTLHALLTQRLGARRAADRLFPSDHRMNDPGLYSICKISMFTAADLLNKALFGRTANMQVIMQNRIAA